MLILASPPPQWTGLLLWPCFSRNFVFYPINEVLVRHFGIVMLLACFITLEEILERKKAQYEQWWGWGMFTDAFITCSNRELTEWSKMSSWIVLLTALIHLHHLSIEDLLQHFELIFIIVLLPLELPQRISILGIDILTSKPLYFQFLFSHSKIDKLWTSRLLLDGLFSSCSWLYQVILVSFDGSDWENVL